MGVRLSTIMRLAKPRKEANFVIFEAAAGYTANIPMTEARKENVILAHSFFGQKLPKEHGAPVRALVPDRYFYKSAKGLEGRALEVTLKALFRYGSGLAHGQFRFHFYSGTPHSIRA